MNGTVPAVEIAIDAFCHDCKHRHRISCNPFQFSTEMGEWEVKHRGHDFEFLSPKRTLPRGLDDRHYEKVGEAPWWLDYRHNANIKLAYGSSAAYTISLASLATSSTFVAGREGTAVSNTSNLYLDYLVGGKITTGTSPAAAEIRIYLYGSIDDTPTYPDVMDGTDSAETVTNTAILNAGLKFFQSTDTTTTSDVTYWFAAVGIAAYFNYLVPKNHGLFVSHNTTVNLNATGGNHALSYTGVYATST